MSEPKIDFDRRESFPAKSAAPLPTYFRVDLSAPVRLRTKDGHCFTAAARNLSLGGLGLQNFRPPFEASGELCLQFPLPETDYLIDVTGVVVWSKSNAFAGVRFTELNTATSELLRDWIATHGQTLPGHSNVQGESAKPLATASA